MAFQRAGLSSCFTDRELEEAMSHSDDSDLEPYSPNGSSDEWKPSDDEECSEIDDNLSIIEDSESNWTIP